MIAPLSPDEVRGLNRLLDLLPCNLVQAHVIACMLRDPHPFDRAAPLRTRIRSAGRALTRRELLRIVGHRRAAAPSSRPSPLDPHPSGGGLQG
jgi:hypothetical protein